VTVVTQDKKQLSHPEPGGPFAAPAYYCTGYTLTEVKFKLAASLGCDRRPARVHKSSRLFHTQLRDTRPGLTIKPKYLLTLRTMCVRINQDNMVFATPGHCSILEPPNWARLEERTWWYLGWHMYNKPPASCCTRNIRQRIADAGTNSSAAAARVR